MSRLNELIQELCPEGVEYRTLDTCCKVLDNKRKPITKSARETGDYPYYGANGIQDYVADYIFDGVFILVGEDGSVMTSNGNPVVTWAEGKIWVNNHAHIISGIDGVLLRYLFHYLQTVNVKHLIHGNIPKLTGGDFKALRIPVPPLEVQKELVRILDSFTALTEELQEKLEEERQALRLQYSYYRNELLTEIISEATPSIELSELCTVVTKQTGFDYSTKIKPSLVKMKNSDNIPFIQNKDFSGLSINLNTDFYIPISVVNQFPRITLDGPAILISISGKVGNVGLYTLNNRAFIGGAVCICKLQNGVNGKFILRYLQSKYGQKYLLSHIKAGSHLNITVEDIRHIKIPILSEHDQERIVGIIDQFETLCNDLSSGLPAEIKARQKQYEYYRDKLLNFKEAF